MSKDKILSLFVAFLVLAIPFPAFLYFEAGKNAFVVASSLIGLLIPAMYIYTKNRSYFNSFCLFLVLTGIALVHYPTYAFALAFAFIVLLVFIMRKRPDDLKTFVRSCLNVMSPVLLSMIFVGAFIFVTHARDHVPAQVNSTKVAQQFHLRAEEGSINKELLTNRHQNTKKSLITNPLRPSVSLVKNIVTFTYTYAYATGLLFLGAILLSLYFVFNNSFSRKSWSDFTFVSMVGLVMAWILIMVSLQTINIHDLLTTTETGYYLVFLLGVLPLAALLRKLTTAPYLLVVFALIVSGGYFGRYTYTHYQNASKVNIVDQQDIQAYAWINKNVSVDSGFIGVSHISPGRANIVNPTDGSLWLPVFTQDNISTPFQSGSFSSVTSHVNYEYLQLLKSSNPADEKRAVDYFVNNGFRYLYIDGPSSYAELNINTLVENGRVQIIYNQGVAIAKLQT